MIDYIVATPSGEPAVINVVEQGHTIITVWPGGPVVVGANGGGGAVQEFVQSVAATNWVFNHTLNRRPALSVTDLAGNNLIVETQVTSTQILVKSVTPITGIVYLF